MKKIKQTKFKLSGETLRVLTAVQQEMVGGGISLNCTIPTSGGLVVCQAISIESTGCPGQAQC